MILEQHYLACLSHASYFIGDPTSGRALVVDPQRDIARYLEAAQKHGLEITDVALTHFHADFLAGHLELARATGARIHLGRRARADFEFAPWKDGEALELGPGVRLVALETPGHTPEGISILVFDLAADAARPKAVLTGDTLFIGDVGRPDLMASVGVTADELAGMLYDSLHTKILPLPDTTIVYPAHGAGSACGKALSSETSAPLGQQRLSNYALAPMSKADFVRLVTADQPTAPAYFGYDADLNRRRRATLDESLAKVLVPLEPKDVLARQAAGALVLDVRDADAFAAEHLANAVNAGLDGKFATWVGSVLAPTQELVLVGGVGDEQQAALRLGRIGFDRVVGFAKGGHAALAAAGLPMAKWPRVEVGQLEAQLAGPKPPLVLDVRAPGEWRDGHVDGAMHVPLDRLTKELGSIPKDRRIAVMCRSGYRSSLAASLLARAGFTDLVDVQGGWLAWAGAAAR